MIKVDKSKPGVEADWRGKNIEKGLGTGLERIARTTDKREENERIKVITLHNDNLKKHGVDSRISNVGIINKHVSFK